MVTQLKKKKPTIQEVFDSHKSPKQCTDTEICRFLSMCLNMSDSRRGMVNQLIVNMKTGKTSRRIYYYGGDFKSGIRLEACPFCGTKLPELKD